MGAAGTDYQSITRPPKANKHAHWFAQESPGYLTCFWKKWEKTGGSGGTPPTPPDTHIQTQPQAALDRAAWCKIWKTGKAVQYHIEMMSFYLNS